MSATKQILQPATQNATYDVDLAHSSAEFGVRHLMISTVKGRMAITRGAVTLRDGAPHIDAELDAASVTTGVAQRDAHLRSADFFDAEKHPTLRFVSLRVDPVGDDKYRVEGQLTIRDATHPVVLEVEKEGEARDPWGKERVALTARTTIDRTQWGLTYNQVLETGGVMVGEKVKIEIHVELVKAA